MGLGDSAKPRWSIGVGKKDDWEGKTKGVTLTGGNHRHGWKEELEVLEDKEEEGNEPHHANLLMKQAMFIHDGWLPESKGTRGTGSDGGRRQLSEPTGGQRRESLIPRHHTGGDCNPGRGTAAVESPQGDRRRANIPRPGDDVAPQRQKTTPLGVKFDGDPQQLAFFLAHVITYMQKYGHKIPTEGTKVRVITGVRRCSGQVDGDPPQWKCPRAEKLQPIYDSSKMVF